MNAPKFSPALLLDELNRRGVQLTAIGDRLRYDAPAGAIGDLIGDLQKFKPQLLEMLGADARIVAQGETAATAAPPASVPARVDVVQYVRAKSAAYWARKRTEPQGSADRYQVRSELRVLMSDDDARELGHILIKLDKGEEIE